MLEKVTPLILTFNEEVNIGRVLKRLDWASEVLVLDSGSTDRTRELALAHGNVRFVTRPFDSHSTQWNFGLSECGISTEWVLALDADYVLSDELVRKLAALEPTSECNGYRASFRYCIDGKALRGSLYPPVTVLFRRTLARYIQEGHTQRLALAGELGFLEGQIDHDDRKPLERWIAAQVRYSRLEVEHLLTLPWARLGWPDRLRTLHVVMPPLAFLYCYLVKQGMLDGRAGLLYSLQRSIAETILSMALLERRMKP